MPRVCILTDSTAQFTRTDFPGWERVFVAHHDLKPVPPQAVGSLLMHSPGQKLVPPSPQDFRHLYQKLSREYDSILVLTLSSLLSPAATHAIIASSQFHNHAAVEVVETRTTSVGLGWLVEEAASAVSGGGTTRAVVKQLRAAIPRIYFLFFIPDLGALTEASHISQVQALVAGMLGILPIFILEDGRLAPLDKARSQRAVLEYFEEFLDEFEAPGRVALVHGSEQSRLRMSPLRRYIQEAYPEADFSEHVFSPQLDAMLGAQSMGMAIKQKG
jgi:DegV family protein with EDD domain